MIRAECSGYSDGNGSVHISSCLVLAVRTVMRNDGKQINASPLFYFVYCAYMHLYPVLTIVNFTYLRFHGGIYILEFYCINSISDVVFSVEYLT